MRNPHIIIDGAVYEYYDQLDVYGDRIANYLKSRQLAPDYTDGLTILFTPKKAERPQIPYAADVLGSYEADNRVAAVYVDEIAKSAIGHIAYARTPANLSRVRRNAAFHLTRTIKHEIEHDIIAVSDERYFQAVSETASEMRYAHTVGRLRRVRQVAAGSLALSAAAGATIAVESGSAIAGAAVGLGGSVLTALEFRRQSMRPADVELEDVALADYADALHQQAYDAETIPSEMFADGSIRLSR